MTWDYIVSQGIDLHVADRIDAASAMRQKKTAGHILERLAEQPGVILADEVGMGKTFVALTVGVSIALQNPDAGPVVVMVPPSVKDKWPRDFGVFFDRCLRPIAKQRVKTTTDTLESGVDFLKALDDPPERQRQLLFLTHGALSRGLTDPWVKLALLKHVCASRRLTEVRSALPRFAGRLLQRKHVNDDVWDRLLSSPPARWWKLLEEADVELDDDPVPEALVRGIDDVSAESISAMVAALHELPRRESSNSDERVLMARRLLNDAFNAIWGEWLSASCKKVRLPLLILDEAHHLKNADTKLASLFHSPESTADASMLAGPLSGVFERMLFLTATPFQLGHGELMNVLTRFASIAWQSEHAPARDRQRFVDDIDALRRALDESQREALGLDRAWGRLRPEHVVDLHGAPMESDTWWRVLVESAAPIEGLVGDVIARYRTTEAAMRRAEEALRPWVIRHLKPRKIASVDRRTVLTGAAIVDDVVPRSGGLDIGGDALLPFLLAARATASIAEASEGGRALFAEGLASSFEAYRDTRSTETTRDEDVVDDGAGAQVSSDIEWYLSAIEAALPRENEDATAAHPKVRATVSRVLQLWSKGEKCLVFCHYRATGKALERHISRALDVEMNALAARRFGCTAEEAVERMDRLRDRLDRTDDSIRRELDARLDSLVGVSTSSAAIAAASGVAEQFSTEQRDKMADVMRRFFRTPSFLSRYFPSADAPGVIDAALEQRDASGLALRDRLQAFCTFLAVRCTQRERDEYLDALGSIQTGERYGREDLDGSGMADHAKLLPNVRLANGSTRDDTRRRLLLAFNTPFFPEVLVASSVLAEGVDLHLDCRFVIHHDLCWNPSTLEQRTGRVDRLGAKADRAGASIHVYLPYVAATQDEKMFRVVSDRERWFQVVMGEKFEIDENATERNAERVPLPSSLAEVLSLKLGV